MNKEPESFSFKPYPKVERTWLHYTKQKDSYYKLNQALNLGLARFLQMGDMELKELHDAMRFDEEQKKKKPTIVNWSGSDK